MTTKPRQQPQSKLQESHKIHCNGLQPDIKTWWKFLNVFNTFNIQWGTQHADENCFPNTATTDMKRFQVFYCLCQGQWVCQSHSCQYNLTSLNFFLTLLSLIFNIYLPIIDAESGYLSIQKFGKIKAVGNRKSTMVYSGFLSNIWPPPLLGRMCWSCLNWAVISKEVHLSIGT